MSEIEIGRLLRASTTACVVGCRVSQANVPAFGGLVRIPLADGYGIYGLIYDIRIEDDGLVRQLVTAEEIDDDVILDNRVNRNVPVEVSVLHVGYRQNGQIYHLLPPHPPLSLDAIYICGAKEACAFTSAGRFGYFRHVLRATDLPIGELLAAHIKLLHAFHDKQGNCSWASSATQELITLLRDDYPTLMTVLSALSDVTM
ncbi:MAG: hypothetical protein GX491_02645 [Chloroflexi bacterium]|nr:hypothetical protein [Chloroflexota bacterium]